MSVRDSLDASVRESREMRERREEVRKEEGADNGLMSAAALVLFAFRGDAAAAPPTDL